MVLLTVFPPYRLTAQTVLSFSAGARYSSPLVRDSIGADAITLRPAIAPSVQLGLSTELDGPWSAAVALDLATSMLSDELGRLTTAALAVTLRRSVTPAVAAFAGVGALGYVPAQDAGVFAHGAGPFRALGVVGLAWHRRPRVEVRYDVHRFSTQALRDAGFSEARVVHRVVVLVGLERTIGR